VVSRMTSVVPAVVPWDGGTLPVSKDVIVDGEKWSGCMPRATFNGTQSDGQTSRKICSEPGCICLLVKIKLLHEWIKMNDHAGRRRFCSACYRKSVRSNTNLARARLLWKTTSIDKNVSIEPSRHHQIRDGDYQ
jgi:hypothetical protein